MKSKSKIKKYPAHYLALALIGTLVLEGVLFNISTPADWQVGASVLDMSSAVLELGHDMTTFFQPLADTVSDVNLFYSLGADQMAQVLDMHESFSVVAIFYDGVNEFYERASVE